MLPSAGTALGKGEALWKGLAASSGDLVVYIDADIVDIGPRFVVGLLGPLLTEPGVRFTKATYDRPLQIGGHVHSSGGGRVTELLAMLVDVVEAYGPDAIIQVDLGRRVHTHRSLDALGRMAAEMLHVAIDRLSRQGRLLLTDPLATALLQPTRDAVGSLAMTSSEVTHGERPPLRDWRERA